MTVRNKKLLGEIACWDIDLLPLMIVFKYDCVY